jgi:hypothetical protein
VAGACRPKDRARFGNDAENVEIVADRSALAGSLAAK